jgi:diguanylate cyclase (GGDEF)-like protein
MLQRRLARLIEPQVLFPALALILLVGLWMSTGAIIRLQRANAERAAAALSRELVDTYEAQVVRALREIDQTLRVVKYWPEAAQSRNTLANLKRNGLLPPDILFAVSIADGNGDIVQSNRPLTKDKNIADQDFFREQRQEDALLVGQISPGANGEATLQFSRRLDAADGSFAGVVVVTVPADYFVSGYEPSQLGRHGLLGLLGTDGRFRVRRTGDSVSTGETADYHAIVSDADQGNEQVPIVMNPWDHTARWMNSRELFGFPLAIVVGLSVDEQMSVAQQQARTHVLYAALASALIILLAAVLGRMSWQLTGARRRASDARVAHAQQVEHLAYHDGLTGLPNRSLFSKLLAQSIAEAKRHTRQLAVAFLDLDRFKQINDTLGHEAGDQLLKEVATRLQGCVRGSDAVARLGGDEFVVLLPELSDKQEAATVAQKILAATAKPFLLLGQEFRVTASIGISIYPHDGVEEQTLTKNADIAMYQAKADGKNNYQFYSEELNANSLERLSLESALRHAMERGELSLHYQAKREIATGRITGMEALLRWEHPDLGTIAPMHFIPIAEETGLILPIGKWVLRTACTQCVSWQKQGLPPLILAINLTARQFHDDHLISDVSSILSLTGFDPRLLEVELHESLLIQDVEKTLRILTKLKALGVRVAVDDFGTGYSSLAMLHKFPLDTIKIDRSVTRDFADDAGNRALADAIIAMGKSLSLTVVAQGVETREQAEHLRTHACDELQGFYFKRPLPADDFAELLRSQTAEITYIGERFGLRKS